MGTMWFVVLAACSGWWPGGAEKAPEGPPARKVSDTSPNVVVITLDTVRADRIGAWGYGRALTDSVDALAASGRRYSRAYSPLPLTIPSHAALFTGRYPASVGIRANSGGSLHEREVTLAERLRDEGWNTAASVAAFVTTKQWGFSQGFDAYFDDVPTDAENFWHGERRGDAVVDDALGWLKEQVDDRPVMLWVHLYDAHFPYTPPDGYLEKTDGRPYDAELAFVDDQVGRLVEAFKGEPTLFVLVSDHGEALGAHEELTHGLYVYEATQHVPMVITGPGIQPEVVDEVVSLVDVMPTVLKHLGLAAPEGMDGRVAPGEPPRPVWVETWQLHDRFGLAPHLGVVQGNWKYIDTPKPELYDLIADPGELKDVSADHPAEVSTLKAALDAFGFSTPTSEDDVALDPGVRAQLEALGYVGGTQPAEPDGPPKDPKDHRELVVDIQRVERMTLLGQGPEATALLEDLIRRYPRVVEFRSRVATMYSRQKRHDDARKAIEEALKIDPKSHILRSALGVQLATAGKFEEASRLFQALAEEVPYMPRIRTMAVLALNNAGQGELALRLGRSYLIDYPDDLSLVGMVGTMLVGSRHLTEGMEMIRRAATADKPEVDVRYLLGSEALGRADLQTAFDMFSSEVEDHDQNLKAWYALARVSARLAKWDDQLRAATAALELNPGDPELHHLKVLALFNLDRYPEARVAVDAGLASHPLSSDLMLMDANLLAKEGKLEAGKKRFEEAQGARKLEEERKAAEVKPEPPPPEIENPLGIPVMTEKDWATGEIVDEGPE